MRRPPLISGYDCARGTVLPGAPTQDPASCDDVTARQASNLTQAISRFYREVFGRNSVDNRGMALQSSIHFGVNYNNAFWNGSQMTYGDGDGNFFLDFTRGDDVIGHELTHGVIQHSARLSYANEAGGLNESLADVFGSMFRQWRVGQTVDAADWVIGSDILGPGAVALGYTCLRDLAKPAAAHCLTAQPEHYSQVTPGMDGHYSSGIPNLAFYNAARSIGGRSWEVAGKIWYRALSGYSPSPNLKMKTFAARTRRLAQSMFAERPQVHAAIHEAWLEVGL